MRMNAYIKKFSEIGIADTQIVGGKNASLGEMFTQLSSNGIQVPDGFATTCFAFEEFLTHNALHLPLHNLMSQLDISDFSNLAQTGMQARELIMKGEMPPEFREDIIGAYRQLIGKDDIAVAVRSSATAEDLPMALGERGSDEASGEEGEGKDEAEGHGNDPSETVDQRTARS